MLVYVLAKHWNIPTNIHMWRQIILLLKERMKYYMLTYRAVTMNYDFMHLIVCIESFTILQKLFATLWHTIRAVFNLILNWYIPDHGHIKRTLSDYKKQFHTKSWSNALTQHEIQLSLSLLRWYPTKFS